MKTKFMGRKTRAERYAGKINKNICKGSRFIGQTSNSKTAFSCSSPSNLSTAVAVSIPSGKGGKRNKKINLKTDKTLESWEQQEVFSSAQN